MTAPPSAETSVARLAGAALPSALGPLITRWADAIDGGSRSPTHSVIYALIEVREAKRADAALGDPLPPLPASREILLQQIVDLYGLAGDITTFGVGSFESGLDKLRVDLGL